MELGWPFGQTTISSERVHQVFSLQLLPMAVEDAESLDNQPAGEDRTCGKGRQARFNNDIKERDGSEHRKDDADSFYPKTTSAM